MRQADNSASADSFIEVLQNRFRLGGNRLAQLYLAAIRINRDLAKRSAQVIVVEDQHAGQFTEGRRKVHKRAREAFHQFLRGHIVSALGDAHGDALLRRPAHLQFR